MLRRQKRTFNIKKMGDSNQKKMCDTFFCIYEANETMYGCVWDRF
jgi:hypothetical protein